MKMWGLEKNIEEDLSTAFYFNISVGVICYLVLFFSSPLIADFSYELAGELYRIYVFCRETLAKAMYKRDLKEVELAESLMKKLYTAFAEVMKEDTSAPLMRNTQQVYAGYTYGKKDLVETYQDLDTSRGFLV